MTPLEETDETFPTAYAYADDLALVIYEDMHNHLENKVENAMKIESVRSEKI